MVEDPKYPRQMRRRNLERVALEIDDGVGLAIEKLISKLMDYSIRYPKGIIEQFVEGDYIVTCICTEGLETDEEYKKRLEIQYKVDEDYKERRRKEYIKLKKEFENDRQK